VRSAAGFTGYRRAGGDSLGGWPSAPTRSYFTGALDEVAMYATVLSATQVASHHGKRPHQLTARAARSDRSGRAGPLFYQSINRPIQ
jgi:hypothetical protein